MAFSNDGTMVQSYMGKQVAKYKYEAHGNELKVFINENTPMVWTIQADKSLKIPNSPISFPIKH